MIYYVHNEMRQSLIPNSVNRKSHQCLNSSNVHSQLEEPENVNDNSKDPGEPPPDSPTDRVDGDELLTSDDTMPPALHRNKTSISPSLQRILDGE